MDLTGPGSEPGSTWPHSCPNLAGPALTWTVLAKGTCLHMGVLMGVDLAEPGMNLDLGPGWTWLALPSRVHTITPSTEGQ